MNFDNCIRLIIYRDFVCIYGTLGSSVSSSALCDTDVWPRLKALRHSHRCFCPYICHFSRWIVSCYRLEKEIALICLKVLVVHYIFVNIISWIALNFVLFLLSENLHQVKIWKNQRRHKSKSLIDRLRMRPLTLH